MTCWKTLRQRFERLDVPNSVSAEWRHLPNQTPSETWQVRMDADVYRDSRLWKALQAAGDLLLESPTAASTFPTKLLETPQDDIERWLFALRHCSINVDRSRVHSYRVDSGTISSLREASAELCSYLDTYDRVHERRRKRSPARQASPPASRLAATIR